MLTIRSRGVDGLHETWDVFLEICFECCLGCFEIDIAARVVFFGTLGGGIESDMTSMRLQ